MASPVVNKEYELYDRQFQVHVRVVGVALACVVGGILVPGKLFCEAAREGLVYPPFSRLRRQNNTAVPR